MSSAKRTVFLVTCFVEMISPVGEVFPTPNQMTEDTVVQAELDVFSGRVNPMWRLSADESSEFLKLFGSLPAAREGTIRSELGYRGIIVTTPGDTIAGFHSVVCSSGIVVGRSPGGEQKFTDRGRALERWLFHTSKGRIDEDIRAAVRQDLDTKN